jgi:hypothetical protein
MMKPSARRLMEEEGILAGSLPVLRLLPRLSCRKMKPLPIRI